MIRIDAATRNLLLNNSVHREIVLRFPDDDIEITSANIVSESFELTQSICDGKDFTLGGGVVGTMQIKLIGVAGELTGKRVTAYVKQTYSANRLVPSASLVPSSSLIIGEQSSTVEYPLFTGKVRSMKRQRNRSVKLLTAYDCMYDFSKTTIILEALTGYAAYTSSRDVTLRGFITTMLNTKFDNIIYNDDTAHFVDTYLLSLRSEYITAAAKNGVSLLSLLQAYAEANAGFIVCDGSGNLHVRSLSKYSDASLHTAKKDVAEVIPSYHSLTFEEYTVKPIQYIRFKYQDKKDFAYGSSKNNSWYLSDNIILRMCESISTIVMAMHAENRSNYIFGNLLTFQPFKADVFARWWLEPGDRVQIKTGYNDIETIDSFVLSRKIKGINGMSVTIEAKAKEYLGNMEIDEVIQNE